jgi:chromosome segregation ATPase
MASFDPTPIVVATISGIAAVTAAFIAYNSGKKTSSKIKSLPSDLVSEFSKMNPGVDTVEKVIELLYKEIQRLTEQNTKLEAKITKLIQEKQELLDEIRAMKIALDEQKRKLDILATRIKNSIPE